MKISILPRCRTLWLLLILISLVEAKPQGYSYPVPVKSNVTTTSITTSTEAIAGIAKETTTAFSGYIIEVEKSSALAESIDVTTVSTSDESETISQGNDDNDKTTENSTEETTEKLETEDANEVTEKQDTSSTTDDASEKENGSEDIQESTTASDDSETTTMISAPYPPSGSRPTGREFSYDVRDLFPGMKLAESTSFPNKPPPSNENLSSEPQLEPRVGSPFSQESVFLMNRLANAAQQALVSPGPQQSYFYRTPQQQMIFNSYQQQRPVNRNFQTERFTMSFPSRSYSQSAPYPPSRPNYDQRFSSSNTVAQSFYQPRSNEYHEEPRYQFQYDVRAPPYGPFFGHKESRTGDEARGEYYVVQPDGRMRLVRYEAGPQGYRPSISYETTLDYQDYP